MQYIGQGRTEEVERTGELGGVARHYLSPGRTGRDDRRPDILFDGREIHLDRIEVIPTPGHTPGSTCFLVQSPHGSR